ncbi:hypothetical protein [Xanthocytophaga agilis]|uniref:Uncharacterized protein n=1 Tax=Xanthocytophaga agilis TaxID=3048010 RepID=A0AAE3UCZ5_9BACT|nr:hypothetical protein [Xanthocytophaga agilis]MDJ1500655.1 hypothetical protein [Xanthocytophaga agilis]
MEETTLTETQPKTEKKPIIDFEFLSKAVPILVSIILLIGILKVHIYYKAFNLPILDYMDVSEVFTYFIHDLYVSIWFLLMIPFYFFRVLDHGLDKHFEERMENLSKRPFLLRTAYYTRNSVIATFFLTGIALSAFSIYLRDHINKAVHPISLLILSTLMLFLLEFLKEVKIRLMKYNVPFGRTTYWFTWGLCIGLYLLFSNTYSLIQHTKLGRYKYVTITLDDKEVKGSITQYYIGKSKDYVFWYNTTDSSTTVYKMDDIKQIRYK